VAVRDAPQGPAAPAGREAVAEVAGVVAGAVDQGRLAAAQERQVYQAWRGRGRRAGTSATPRLRAPRVADATAAGR
jgi:hypothetical protein